MSDPARLPKGAPRSLRQFVKCEVDEAALDLTDAAWLNEIPMISGATTSARAGSTPNSATVTFDAEWTPAFDLEVSVVDGRLVASVPGTVGQVANQPITEWTDALNKTLADNDKQIRDLSVDGTTLRLRKQPIPPPPVDDPIPATPPVVEVPAPEPKSGGGIGCLPKILAGVTAVLVAVGIVAATRGGDDESSDSVVTESAPAASDAPPSTDPPATTSTSTASPTSTIAQVGAVDDPGPVATGFALCVLVDDELSPHGSIDVPDGNCDPGDRTTVYNGCDATLIPCSSTQLPPFLQAGTPGVDHQRQAPDAVTGQTGASTRAERIRFLFTGVGPVEIRTSATCSGTVVNGAGTTTSGEPVDIDSPLYEYGLCDELSMRAVYGEGDEVREWEFPQADEQIVDASESEPRLDTTRYFFDHPAFGGPSDDVLDDLGNSINTIDTINNVIGGNDSVGDDCVFLFEPQNVSAIDRVLDGCGDQHHFWVFAAGTTNVDVEITVTDAVTGTTATYANPLGRVAPPMSDTDGFDATGTLFDHSVFPCGFGFVAYTACAEGAPPMEAGGFVTVSATMGGRVPFLDDGVARRHDVDFGTTGGGRYSIVQRGDDWVVTSSAGDTRARALIRGNSITLIVPNDELPETAQSYQWTADIDGVTIEQPVIPVVGVITVPPVEQTAPVDEAAPDEAAPAEEPAVVEEPAAADESSPVESLADFYRQLSASLSAGDLGFALDRLDPRVVEVYGDSCPAALESFADPDLNIEFVSAGPIEDWVYEANEQSVEVPDSQAVTIRLSGRGQSGEESVAHLSIADGTYRWFTFC